MKKINFTCPHCGGHTLIAERPLQWIRLDVLGFDEDGDLLFDHAFPRHWTDNNDDFKIYCNNCYAEITEQEITEQNKKKITKAKKGVNNETTI